VLLTDANRSCRAAATLWTPLAAIRWQVRDASQRRLSGAGIPHLLSWKQQVGVLLGRRLGWSGLPLLVQLLQAVVAVQLAKVLLQRAVQLAVLRGARVHGLLLLLHLRRVGAKVQGGRWVWGGMAVVARGSRACGCSHKCEVQCVADAPATLQDVHCLDKGGHSDRLAIEHLHGSVSPRLVHSPLRGVALA
jgi:hypothetical protein